MWLDGWNRRGSDLAPALDRAAYRFLMKRRQKQGDYMRVLSAGDERQDGGG